MTIKLNYHKFDNNMKRESKNEREKKARSMSYVKKLLEAFILFDEILFFRFFRETTLVIMITVFGA